MTEISVANNSEDQSRLLKDLKCFYEEVPVHRLLGLRVESMDLNQVRLRLDMKNDLIGDHVNGFIHGGIITAVLDSTAGVTLWLEIVRQLGLRSSKDFPKYLAAHTIDFRVDFFKPGEGKCFFGSGNVMNFGRRIAVVRSELRDDSDTLIAMGTGTYMRP